MVRKSLDTKVGETYWMFSSSFFLLKLHLEQLMVIVKSLPLNTSLEEESYSKCASHMIINHKYQKSLDLIISSVVELMQLN